ncbi:MAG TPA: hypothetical protein VN132_10075 [Bdellovibrio sp.]|nr:hypothetical protein [Bdellovibrio sp.]
MLQNLLFIFTTAFASFAFAHENVLVQSPGASPIEFEKALHETKTWTSYVDLQVSRIQKNIRQEDKVLSLSEKLQSSPTDLRNTLDQMQSESALTETSLHFLRDLSEKVLAGTMNPSDTTYYKSLFCKASGVSSDAIPSECGSRKVDLAVIHRQWPLAQVLMIENKRVNLEETSPQIPVNVSYHWTLLSNSQKVISFYGTYEQFLQQHFVSENLVDGTCEGFSSSIDDFEVSAKAIVFFSKDCTKALIEPDHKSSFAVWFEENKTWVYPVGAVLLGGAILSAQGKNIVIDKP